MKVENFRAVFGIDSNFNRMIQRFVFTFIEQTAQIGACNGCHSLEKRLARLLLMHDDRTKGDIIRLTQESIAQILGTQRPSVSIKAKVLKESGVIDYLRGGIQITDRARLKDQTCECYDIIKQANNSYLALLKDGISAATRMSVYNSRHAQPRKINQAAAQKFFK